MNPLALYPAIALVALLTIGGFYKYGYSSGWDDRDAEMQIEIAKKNEEARELERTMNSKIIASSNKLQEANHVIDKKQTDLNRLIATGRVRLPSSSCVQASANTPVAAGDRDETGSQPDRQVDQAADADRATLQAIAEIVAQGDRNTAQLNACIDAYDQMRSITNGDK
jgi:FtsZ-interacting cell division protein ZipA